MRDLRPDLPPEPTFVGASPMLVMDEEAVPLHLRWQTFQTKEGTREIKYVGRCITCGLPMWEHIKDGGIPAETFGTRALAKVYGIKLPNIPRYTLCMCLQCLLDKDSYVFGKRMAAEYVMEHGLDTAEQMNVVRKRG